MQAKIHENFCCLLQIFDNQIDNFVTRNVISMFYCKGNHFFAIFAPSLTNILHHEIITN